MVLPKPYVPPGQVWHAVDTPSTKYCPLPQHTGVPVGVQWPEGVGELHEGEQLMKSMFTVVSPRKL